jgi:hypothetical protein
MCTTNSFLNQVLQSSILISIWNHPQHLGFHEATAESTQYFQKKIKMFSFNMIIKCLYAKNHVKSLEFRINNTWFLQK